jgi:hypothetical protein
MSEGTESPPPPPVEFNTAELERIRRQNLENIRAKAMRGESLTDGQVRLLEEACLQSSPAGPSAPNAVYVTTQQLLAEALGITNRKTIQRWLADGAPKPTDDGRYDVTAWRMWMESNGRGERRKKDDPESVKTQIALTELRRKQIELAELEGSKLDVDEVVTVCSEIWNRLAQKLHALRHDLAPAVVGETVAQATARMEVAHREVLLSLSVPPASKKKAFWKNASARLYDLQQTFLRSPTRRSTSSSTTAATATPT